ncbi:MAG: L,D-transpeptidase family protein [bacterium]|nr:L,D-transpeptidase family protein [bacterium]
MYERSNGRWSLAFLPKSAIIGHKGFAGIDMKKEGDGKTPSGIYTLGTAFGYGKTVETGLPYRQTGKNDFWVDDPKSKQYNKWINGKPKAASFEKMKRKDDLYKLGIVIHYNMAPIIRGKGSAIFIHIWSPNGSATTGCISLSERDVREILEWLKKSNNPGIIMGVARDLISLLPHGVGQQ